MQKLKYSLWAKVVAVVLFMLLLITATAGVIGGVILAESGFYTTPVSGILDQRLRQITRNNMQKLYYQHIGFVFSEEEGIYHFEISRPLDEKFSKANSNFMYRVLDADGKVLLENLHTDTYAHMESNLYTVDMPEEGVEGKYYTQVTVQGFMAIPQQAKDEYVSAQKWVNTLYGLRYWVFVLAGVCLLLDVLLLVFLFSSAGYRVGTQEAAPGPLERIPADVLAFGLLVVLYIQMVVVYRMYSDLWRTIFLAGFTFTDILLLLMFCLSLAVRCKCAILVKNTLLYRALRHMGKGLRWLGENVLYILRRIPLVWKAVALFAALSLAEFIVLILCWYETDTLSLWWAVEKMVLAAVVCVAVLNMRDIQSGAQRLAKGDLEHKVSTDKMFWEFKRHAQHLNNIGDGMSKAVEERMKSERFKTELITNVSHDIKTPLTSIINYVDLLKKEDVSDPQIQEYIDVLDRQSSRLKKLIEDLTEASKASSGSIHAEITRTDAGVLLAQTVGEYSRRIQNANLQLLVGGSEENKVFLLADGRLLARIFDNLMSNICKYAMPGTRVYVDLEPNPDAVRIVFRNISGYPLNISSEELMERFVRGDRSRHTEGSGLGLSIARSLTELQGGRFDLYVDGDLFKVILTFPAAQEKTKNTPSTEQVQ